MIRHILTTKLAIMLQFSNDPWHLLLTQQQAVAVLAWNSCFLNQRGVDGKILRITGQEERGLWWSLQILLHAWAATPEGAMPKPFQTKAFFAQALENTLAYMRDSYMNLSAPRYTGITAQAVSFWRCVVPFNFNVDEVCLSAFMCDYGHIVCCQGLLLGYSGMRDFAEWFAVNAELRASMEGNWYLCDKSILSGLAMTLAKTYDTTLQYSDAPSFKVWYPRKGGDGYVDGILSPPNWRVDSGRDTYMFLGVLNLYKEVAARGLITINFDAAAARSSMLARHPGPYTTDGTVNTLPLGYYAHSKQFFSY